MASTNYINANPRVIDLGPKDNTTKPTPRVSKSFPQHCPKVFGFAQCGETAPRLVPAQELPLLYGDRTFDLTDIYATHQTPFITGFVSKANQMVFQRVIPPDAGPRSSIQIWLDVLPTTVDLYRRNSDGSIATDGLNQPIVTGTTPGYKVKFVVTSYTDVEDLAAGFGRLTQKRGDQIDSKTGTQSTRYPFMEFIYNSQGELGNLSGIRMWAQTTATVTELPVKVLTVQKAFPYYFQVMRRASATSSAQPVATLLGDQKVMFTLKPKTSDPTTNLRLYIGEVAVKSFEDKDNSAYTLKPADFNQVKVYEQNIATLLGMFHAAEVPFLDASSDMSSDESSKYLFNLITGVSSQNVPYHSFVFVDDQNATRWSDYTTVYAAGGSDGTMSNEVFDQLVGEKMDEYADPASPVQERATNVESVVYDSGFSVPVKYKLLKMLTYRRDTNVALSTYVFGDDEMTAAEEASLGAALRVRAQMYPESEYFGTGVQRAVVMAQSMRIRNSLWSERVPLTYELAMKRARCMGASDGKWKASALYDRAPLNILEEAVDISLPWIPDTARNRFWELGMNYAIAYDQDVHMFPMVRTVFDSDNSALNGDLGMQMLCYLNKLTYKVWREFTGTQTLTNAQLIKQVNAYAASLVEGNIFAKIFSIRPMAEMSPMDLLRNTSWSLPWEIGIPGSKTVMTTSMQIYRIEDLTATK